MRKQDYKGRCEKRQLSKCEGVFKSYDALQTKYALMLEDNEEVIEIKGKVPLDGLEEGKYMSDFVCTKEGGDIFVRESIQRKYLLKPMNVRLLEASRNYWSKRGVVDWGIVVDGEE